jgi:hypothetical protein
MDVADSSQGVHGGTWSVPLLARVGTTVQRVPARRLTREEVGEIRFHARRFTTRRALGHIASVVASGSVFALLVTLHVHHALLAIGALTSLAAAAWGSKRALDYALPAFHLRQDADQAAALDVAIADFASGGDAKLPNTIIEALPHARMMWSRDGEPERWGTSSRILPERCF